MKIKNVGVRKVKKTGKSGREKEIVPVRIFEKRPKAAFPPTFEYHAKKKHSVGTVSKMFKNGRRHLFKICLHKIEE